MIKDLIKNALKILFIFVVFLCVLRVGGYSWGGFSRTVELKDPTRVLAPVMGNLPSLPDTDINLPFDVPEFDGSSGGSLDDLPPRPDVSLPSYTPISAEQISITSSRAIKVSINGNDIEISSSTTIDFLKFMATNYTEDAPVTYNDVELEVSYDDSIHSGAELEALVGSITIVDEIQEVEGYDRAFFERPVVSYELDGETVNRNDYSWKTSSFLESEEPFLYVCPYTNDLIFDESKLDYDHIVPLHSVWSRGGCEWTNEELNAYAYDQWVGIDVLYSANRSKSDKGPADWLPSVNVEDYCYTWLLICSKYNLVMTEEEVNICVTNIQSAFESGEPVTRLGGY